MNKKTPIGYWVFLASIDADLLHWGKDGDTQKPLKTKDEAVQQARYISETEDGSVYIVSVFANGVVFTEEFL